jgi:uncharacterized damage-inducible protein DinB
MADQVAFARGMLQWARQQWLRNVQTLTLGEALFAADGHRSILGVLKHLGGWTHVYRSYAFDVDPKHFAETSWPRGLTQTIDPSSEYVTEVIAWLDAGLTAWDDELAQVGDDDLARPRPVHWGGSLPLREIVGIVVHHVAYHTGELNMLLSIARQEAWEYGEEVEENHISTDGHGVRPHWMSDEHARAHEEAHRRAHDARRDIDAV